MAGFTPVDYTRVEKPVGYNAYKRAEEEFQLKKALAMAEVQARQDANEMKRQEMNSLTPYQAASLAMQQERLNLQKQKGGTMVDPDTGELISTSPQKPLPVGALKMQDEAVTAIGSLDTTAKNAAEWSKKLREGKVPVTPLGKTEAFLRNKTGFSDEPSRELGLYNTFIEKMRNDLLLLAKGVQTEGDAKRALNAITAAGNDPVLLADAMEKAAAVSEKGAKLERDKVNLIRQNYGLPNLDIPKPGQSGVVPEGATATNPQTGQKIKFTNGKWMPMQ